MGKYSIIIGLVLILFSCKTTQKSVNTVQKVPNDLEIKSDLRPIEVQKLTTTSNQSINDTTFVNLKSLSNDFVYDLKYATEDNFLKTKVYDCAECYLRYKTAKALIKANKSFLKRGYRIKLWDCYRPLEVQQKMWQIVPNNTYVANPKKGSIHNRGGAVDLTLVDKDGKELDMGTGFDHFGPEAAHDYQKLSEQVIENRKLLQKIMIENHFVSYASEWWHYHFKNAPKEKLSNYKWNCE